MKKISLEMQKINEFCEQIGEQNGNNKNEWYNNI